MDVRAIIEQLDRLAERDAPPRAIARVQVVADWLACRYETARRAHPES